MFPNRTSFWKKIIRNGKRKSNKTLSAEFPEYAKSSRIFTTTFSRRGCRIGFAANQFRANKFNRCLENRISENFSSHQTAEISEIDFNYEEGAKGGFTPVVRNYVVENLTSGKSEYAMDAQGLANAPIYGLKIKNSRFDNVANGAIAENLKDASLENVKINGKVVSDINTVKVAPKKKG